MSPELERAHAEHQMMVDCGVDAEVIRHIVNGSWSWSKVADEIIDYLLTATS